MSDCPKLNEKDAVRFRLECVSNMTDTIHQNLRKCVGEHYYGKIADHIYGSVICECLDERKDDFQSVTKDDIANATGKVILNIIEERNKNDWIIPILKRDLGALLVALQKDPLINWDNCKKLKCMKNLETFIRKDM